ncbi:MAG: thioredoxin family protein, partial [Salibacteraceae bacterium]
MTKNLLAIAFTMVFLGSLVAQEKSMNFINQDIATAKAKAKESGKLIFVDAYATWCGPCKWMSANIFTNDTVSQFFNQNFISLKLDMEKGEGIEFKKSYGIKYFPTLLFIDAEGNEMHRSVGASKKVEDYIDLGLTALNPIKRIASYHSSFKSGEKSAAFLNEYLELLDESALPTEEVIKSYYEGLSEDELLSENAWSIINKYDKSVDSKGMLNVLNKREDYSKAFGQDKVDEKLYKNYLTHMYAKVYSKEFSMKEMELTMIKIKKLNVPYWEKIILLGDLAHLSKEKKYKDYCEVAVEDIGDYFNEDPNALNEFAWNVFEWSKKKPQLEVALGWSKLSIELDENPMYIDTYANLLYKLGKKDEARNQQQKAIDMLEKNGEDATDYKATLDG